MATGRIFQSLMWSSDHYRLCGLSHDSRTVACIVVWQKITCP